MLKESVQDFMDNKILIRELKKNYKDFECYKLGIIDSQGNKIKTPITEQEQMAYSPTTRTILKLKKFLGAKIDLLEAINSLEESTVALQNIEKYKKQIEYKNRLTEATNEIFKILDEAVAGGFSIEDVKKLIKA